MEQEVYKKTDNEMEKAIENMKKGFSMVRTGRASAAIFENVLVDYYGAAVGLKQLANIIIRDARMIEVKPFDKNACGAIEKAILAANVGITPVNDGVLIRLEVPPLTEERRIEIKKLVKKIQEEHKVELRNVRRDANDELKALGNNKKISEDTLRIALDKVQKMTDGYMAEIDRLYDLKSKEIMEV